MVDIHVKPETLRDAADATREAAERVRGAGFADSIRDIAAAMPESRSGAVAVRLGSYWEWETRRWVANMLSRADALVTAADAIETDERAMEDDFGRGGSR
ncbi:MAG: hypothetical protein ACRDQW_11075 [Haloechinothrix sp.]